MRSFDFAPYRRSTVGFDRLFDYLESARADQPENYPPFDIEITAHQNLLTVAGRRADNRGRDGNYLHMGIATRAFERRFELADFVRPDAADMKDGLLTIDLVREIPEAMKPRKIDIGGGRSETIEGRDEAPQRASSQTQHETA